MHRQTSAKITLRVRRSRKVEKISQSYKVKTAYYVLLIIIVHFKIKSNCFNSRLSQHSGNISIEYLI